MLAQLKVIISQGEHAVMVTVLVQKDAPSPLLLGTDVLSSFGFYCTFHKPDGTSVTTNLLEEVSSSPQVTARMQELIPQMHVKVTLQTMTLQTNKQIYDWMQRLIQSGSYNWLIDKLFGSHLDVGIVNILYKTAV